MQIKDLHSNPLRQFGIWYAIAEKSNIPQYNAMALATVSTDLQPSLRFVLLKEYNDQGFVFYTNYMSPKAQQLEQNPRCALVFYWQELDKQIRIEGKAVKVSSEISQKYFATRPRNSQIAAMASKQSQELEDRNMLEERYNKYQELFKDQEQIDLPDYWGGFCVCPDRYEFWQNRPDRLHDRFMYTLDVEQEWEIKRLYP
jgi:pyridoxamine 5'-phosphate oxidase